MGFDVLHMRWVTASVAAIALLTGCSSGDIVVKTDLGESYIVKDSAVTKLDSPIEDKISSLKESIKDAQDFYEEMKSKAKACMSRNVLSQAKCDEIYLRRDAELDDLVRQAESHVILLKEAEDAKDPLIKQVKYRPIFIDLNDKKEALGYVTLTCVNPSLDAKKAAGLILALEESIDDVDLRKAYYLTGFKVCQKYAFKDTKIFAYREAKKSDES